MLSVKSFFFHNVITNFITKNNLQIVCGGCHTMILASPHSTSNKLSFIKEIKQKKSEELFPYENKVVINII